MCYQIIHDLVSGITIPATIPVINIPITLTITVTILTITPQDLFFEHEQISFPTETKKANFTLQAR